MPFSVDLNFLLHAMAVDVSKSDIYFGVRLFIGADMCYFHVLHVYNGVTQSCLYFSCNVTTLLIQVLHKISTGSDLSHNYLHTRV